MSNVNPDIRKIFVGKKTLAEYEVFPLSIGDQRKVSSILIEAYKAFSARVHSIEEESQEEVVNVVIDTVYADVPKVFALVLDVPFEKAVEVFDSMTNLQLSELIDIIWQVNYKSLEKNESGLFPMILNLLKSQKVEQAESKVRSLRKKQ